MIDEQHQNQLRMDACFTPALESATRTWYAARHRFQYEPMRQTQDAYDAATNALGLAFSEWVAEQPEVFEQLRLWLNAHSKG